MDAELSLNSPTVNLGEMATLSLAFTPGSVAIASLQCDLTGILPADLEGIDKGDASLAAGKDVQYNYLGDTLRIIVFGLNINTIQAGILATIRVLAKIAGATEITFSNLVASDPNGIAVALTGINGTLTVLGGTMPTEQDLDNALQTISDGMTTLTTAITELVTQVNALVAKIQANPAVDLTDEIATVQNLATAITTNSQAVQSAIDAAKTVNP